MTNNRSTLQETAVQALPPTLPSAFPIPRPPRPHGRRAFTLVELLVVIGILIVLIGVVVFSLGRTTAQIKVKHTRAQLEVARSMVAEFEATGGNIKTLQDAAVNVYYGTPYNLVNLHYVYPWPPVSLPFVANQIGTTIPNSVALVPNGVTQPALSRTLVAEMGAGGSRNELWLVISAEIIERLLANPNNLAVYSRLPNELKGTLYDPITNRSYRTLLDGFGNPLLYVPGGGLRGIGRTGVAYNSTPGSTPPLPDIVSRDGRPFWASAGPDGLFNSPTNASAGDDNIYSFEQ